MRYIAAYLLASLNGKPTVESVRNIIGAVGIDLDETRLKSLFTELDGKNIEDVIAEGSKKLSSMSVGAPVGVGPSVTAETKEETEEKKEESESDEEMGFNLFD